MTRTGKMIANWAVGVALVGGIFGIGGVLAALAGDVAVVHADVARHEVERESTIQRLHAVELTAAVLPDRLESMVHRIDDILRRIERLEPRGPRTYPEEP